MLRIFSKNRTQILKVLRQAQKIYQNNVEHDAFRVGRRLSLTSVKINC